MSCLRWEIGVQGRATVTVPVPHEGMIRHIHHLARCTSLMQLWQSVRHERPMPGPVTPTQFMNLGGRQV